MSDIFDESEDLKNVRSFVSFLRSEYQRVLHDGDKSLDPINIRLRNNLAVQWPGDDIVQQIVKDTAEIMHRNNIKPGDMT